MYDDGEVVLEATCFPTGAIVRHSMIGLHFDESARVGYPFAVVRDPSFNTIVTNHRCAMYPLYYLALVSAEGSSSHPP